MAVYTERVQTVLTKEQYERLLELAEQEQKPLSILIREAVEEIYFVPVEQQKRQQAMANLLALEAPVADWSQMEAEIERGAIDE
jgi:predicted transcriptional regulator